MTFMHKLLSSKDKEKLLYKFSDNYIQTCFFFLLTWLGDNKL